MAGDAPPRRAVEARVEVLGLEAVQEQDLGADRDPQLDEVADPIAQAGEDRDADLEQVEAVERQLPVLEHPHPQPVATSLLALEDPARGHHGEHPAGRALGDPHLAGDRGGAELRRDGEAVEDRERDRDRPQGVVTTRGHWPRVTAFASGERRRSPGSVPGSVAVPAVSGAVARGRELMPGDAVAVPPCPHAELGREFKPFDTAEPFAFYARARAQAPIFYSPEIDYWVVTRYEDIREIFRNPATFSSENTQAPFKQRPAEVQKILDDGGFANVSGLSGRQPPDHTRLRGFIKKAFTPRRVASLEPDIRAIATCDDRPLRPPWPGRPGHRAEPRVAGARHLPHARHSRRRRSPGQGVGPSRCT